MKKKLIILAIIAIALCLLTIFSVLGSASSSLELPLNNSILNSKTVYFNATGLAGYTYNATIGYSNGTSFGTKIYVNDTTTHFWNVSTLEIDSGYGLWHNYTLYENAVSQGTRFFRVDSTVPTIVGTPTFTLGNKSTGGNYINVTFNVTDANPSSCKVRLYYGDGKILNATSEVSYNSTPQWAWCFVNVTPSDVTKDGYVEIVPTAQDQAGNENISGTNQSYIFYRLKTGWNIITGYENKTLSQIAGEFTNVTYVSVFDNRPDMKNFTTFTVGGSTNSGIGSNHSSNYSYGAAYIYVNADVVSMRRYYAPPAAWQNVTLYANSTAGKTDWNLLGVTKQLTNLNTTLTGNVCTNTTGAIVGANCANLTWMSFYSIQEAKPCSFYRGRLATSCSLTSDQYNLTRGDALWIAVQDTNVILMRGSWS